MFVSPSLMGAEVHMVASFPMLAIKKRLRMRSAWLSLLTLPVAMLLYRTRGLALE
jgi:hypothetical protein